MIAARSGGLPTAIIDRAVRLDQALIHQPFVKDDLEVHLSHDVLDYWHKVRNGEQPSLREPPQVVEINCASEPYDDLQKWCREIIFWRHNKKGVCLYAPRAAAITPEVAGHY